MSPIVSVIVPAYNQARFLRQAIDSVLAQTLTDYEIIVINDGSTDETSAIMAEYGDQICAIHQENKGLSGARNSGLAIAQGEFIGFLDSDDVWYPDMLQNTVSFLQRNPKHDLVAGSWDLINEHDQIIGGVKDLSLLKKRLEVDFLSTIAVGNFVIPSTLLVKRSCFECCGNFDETLKGVEDWDILTRFAVHGHKMGLIEIPVLHYRRHQGCLTRNPERTEQASQQAIEKLFSDENLVAHLASQLQQHAYVYAWLSIAGYAQEAGLTQDTERLVNLAEQHYRKASPNVDLSLEYLNRLSAFPTAEHFMQLIVESTAVTQPLYLWLMARRRLKQRRFMPALVYSLKLMVTHPMWLIRKIGTKTDRKTRKLSRTTARTPRNLPI